MKDKDRKKQIRKRKNFLPLFAITFILWLITGGIIYFVNPDTFGAIPLFFITIFLSIFLTGAILLENTRRGLIIAFFTIFFLFLRFLGVGNLINFLLILGIILTTEIYFSKK